MGDRMLNFSLSVGNIGGRTEAMEWRRFFIFTYRVGLSLSVCELCLCAYDVCVYVHWSKGNIPSLVPCPPPSLPSSSEPSLSSLFNPLRN